MPRCLIFFTLLSQLLFNQAALGQQREVLSQRVYVLAGYIPEFFDTLSGDPDPFAEPEDDPFETNDETAGPQRKTIIDYLRINGNGPKKVEYHPEYNALVLTDTPDNLKLYDVLIQGLFRPDSMLQAIQKAKQMIKDKTIFERDDTLARIVILEDTTLRAFQGEIERLKREIEQNLPKFKDESAKAKKHLELAKRYRQKAIALYLDSLEKQHALVEAWKAESEALKKKE